MSEVEMNCKEVWLIIRKSRPTIGKTLIYTDKMLRVVGEYSGVVPISIVGRVLGGVGRIVLMSNRQRIAELGAQVAGIHDMDDLSPDDMELLDEMLALQNDDVSGKIAEGFREIRDILAALTEKVDDIQEQITEMHYAAEYKRILVQYTKLMRSKASGNLAEWALNFQQNLSNFEDTLSGFSKDNVTSYLKKIYKQKCTDSMAPMYETYKFIMHARSLYLEILVAYYENIPSDVLVKIPNLNPFERILDEIENAEKAVLDINAAANDAFSGFFMAAFTSHPEWIPGLRYAPDFEDVEKSKATFWKKTTWEYLKSGEYFGKKKLHVYKHQESSFIRCHYPTFNQDFIYNLGDDGRIQSGINRYKYADGSASIGSRFFEGDIQMKGNWYTMKKYGSGEIYYDHRMVGKDDKSNVVKKYSFNSTTLQWTELHLGWVARD